MIHGHYIEQYIVNKNKALPTSEQFNTWWGRNNYNSQFSPYQRTMDKCDAINFFLYGSEYLKGDKKLSKLSASKRLKTLDDFYRFIISGNRGAVILSFNTTGFAKRTRFFL